MTDCDLITREFPDFDLATLPTIPDGFTCRAWRNDTCPTWEEGNGRIALRGELMLAIDFTDPELREFPEGHRFSLHLRPADDCSTEPLLSSDNWQEIEAAIRLLREARA